MPANQNRFVCNMILINSDWSICPSPLTSASSTISSSSFCVNLMPASWQALRRLSSEMWPVLSVGTKWYRCYSRSRNTKVTEASLDNSTNWEMRESWCWMPAVVRNCGWVVMGWTVTPVAKVRPQYTTGSCTVFSYLQSTLVHTLLWLFCLVCTVHNEIAAWIKDHMSTFQ